jgi:hypothetical protein
VQLGLAEAMRRRGKGTAVGIAIAALGFFSAACGAGASPAGVASVGSSTSMTASASAPAGNSGPPPSPRLQKAQIKYSVCMRKNGVPSFPDPVADGGYGTGLRDIDQNSHAFLSATKACTYLAEAAGMAPWTKSQWEAYDARLLKITDCMRSHGVTNFPDPKGGEQGGWRFNAANPIDMSSAQYAKAAKACNAPPGPGIAVKQSG